jgi:hypothetical protein
VPTFFNYNGLKSSPAILLNTSLTDPPESGRTQDPFFYAQGLIEKKKKEI